MEASSTSFPKVSQQTSEALSFLQHFSNVRAVRAKVENSIPNLRRKAFILPRTKSKRPKSVVCQKMGIMIYEMKTWG